ncbi:hypothetical protein CCR80_03580 [Rhodothalassium salexigens]|nr:hypothetical protein [Rhodothalassium salexigens]
MVAGVDGAEGRVSRPFDADPVALPARWHDRVLVPTLAADTPPRPWVARVYAQYRARLTDKRYPCHFGYRAESRGEIYYAFLDAGEEARLAEALSAFIHVWGGSPAVRNNLAVFLEPCARLDHRAYGDRFWRLLGDLQAADPAPADASTRLAPDDALWEFEFARHQFFVVGAAPSYARRLSRNLGDAQVLLFQPRSVFMDHATGALIDDKARDTVRTRLGAWDSVAPHRDLGVYGDADNLEWRQYFLADDDQRLYDRCPLAAAPGAPAMADDPGALVARVEARGGRISATGDRLRIEAPTGAIDADLRTALADAKPALLAHLRAGAATGDATGPGGRGAAAERGEQGAPGVPADPGTPGDAGDPGDAPLTFAQEPFVYLSRLGMAGDAYPIQSIQRLPRPVDADLAARALGAVVAWQPALRTHVVDRDQIPRQRVAAAVPLPFYVSDLSALDPDARQVALTERLTQLRQTPFDLARPPLFRFDCIRLGPDDHVIAFHAAHLICDADALDLLFIHLLAAYEALAAGRAPSLPPLTIDLAALARRQKAALRGGAYAAHLSYWREKVRGLAPVLPALGRAERCGDTAAVSADVTLDRSMLDAVDAFCRRHRLARSVLCQGAFQLLLAARTGLRDVTILTPVAARDEAVAPALIGNLTHNLVARLRFRGDEPVATILARAQREQAQILRHKAVPIEVVAQFLLKSGGRRHDLERLSKVAFNYIDADRRPGGETVVPADAPPPRTPRAHVVFDLMAIVVRRGGGLSVTVEARRAVFGAAAVARLAEDYAAFLSLMLAAAETAFDDLVARAGDRLAGPVARPRASAAVAIAGLPPAERAPTDDLPAPLRLPHDLVVGDRVSRGVAVDADLSVAALLGRAARVLAYLAGVGGTAGLPVSDGAGDAGGLWVEDVDATTAEGGRLVLGPVSSPGTDRPVSTGYGVCAVVHRDGLDATPRPLDPGDGVRFDIGLDAAGVAALRVVGRAGVVDAMRLPERLAVAPETHGVLLGDERDRLRAAGFTPPLARPAIAAERSLADRVKAVAVDDPDRPAVIADAGGFSYGALWAAAGRLHGHLSDRGLEPGDRVVLPVGRSPQAPLAVLACLMAGMPFVAVDPTQPAARLAAGVRAADPALVLTGFGAAADRAAAGEALAHLPRLDIRDAALRPARTAPMPVSPAAGALAYILFTSGSTGAPKGVPVTRAAFDGLLSALIASDLVAGPETLLAVTPLFFDIALVEYGLPLATGGTVVMADDRAVAEPERLIARLTGAPSDRAPGSADRSDPAQPPVSCSAVAAPAITMMQATPSLWSALVAAELPDVAIKALCGGEPLSARLASDLSARVAGLWNLYGPTETTIWSTAARLDTVADDPVPVGRPLPGTRVAVVDPQGLPVPPGRPGELIVGGEGVSPGYLGRVDPARFGRWRAFVRDGGDMGGDAGAAADAAAAGDAVWAFRTGDRALLGADGQWRCLGRLDGQVKVNGQRLELGEVEHAALALPGIAAAVAGLYQTPAGPAVALAVEAAGSAGSAGSPTAADLRDHLARHLPPFAIPGALTRVDRLPRLANGKLDRAGAVALATADQAVGAGAEGSGGAGGGGLPGPNGPVSAAVRARVRAAWVEVLGRRDIGDDDTFFDVGGTSLALAALRRRLGDAFGRLPDMADLFSLPTVGLQAALLDTPADPAANRAADRHPVATRLAPPVGGRRAAGDDAIAIVGMAGRFPGAADLDAFWDLIVDGGCGLAPVPDPAADPLSGLPGYVPMAGSLGDVDRFDAGFFSLSAQEARLLDPQHRLLLSLAQHAFDDAGLAPASVGGPGDASVGVFTGVGISAYLVRNLLQAPETLKGVSPFEVLYGVEKDYAASRLAYQFGLTGPCQTIATACSTALVCIHHARRSLLAGECRMALAGAVKITVPEARGYLAAPGGIVSASGRCRPFDAAADGTVFANGGGLVALKRLDDALADGDRVRAVIRGSAVNNDGAAKTGYTAPSQTGQAAVIRDALAAAGVDAATVDYVETHGTGTALGDAIEAAALDATYGAARRAGEDGVDPLMLGAVKGSVGHLDPAAGIAGLIKTVLCLERRLLPPVPGLDHANPALGLDRADAPLRVVGHAAPWPHRGRPARAGVSAFGIGGVNAHLVVEEAPAVPSRAEAAAPGAQLITVSACSADALRRQIAALGALAATPEPPPLPDLAHALHGARSGFAFRTAVLADDLDQMAAALAEAKPATGPVGSAPPLILLFPGQGAQHAGMAAGLYRSVAAFRDAFDAAVAALAPHLDLDVAALALGEGAPAGLVADTRRAQPLLFAVQYAAGRACLDAGLRPSALVGHSVGEVAALALAEALTLDQAARLVAVRAETMATAPAGSMAAVFEAPGALDAHLDADVTIAAVNAPRLSVIAGPRVAMARTLDRLAAAGIDCRPVNDRYAFHHPVLAEASAALRASLADLVPTEPRIPVISTLTGKAVSLARRVDGDYWADQMLAAVRFDRALATALDGAPATLLDLGPGRALAAAAGFADLPAQTERLALIAEPQAAPDGRDWLDLLGRLWCRGHELDWARLKAPSARRCAVPAYPFDRRRHWVEPEAKPSDTAAAPPPIRDWGWRPVWRPLRLDRARSGPTGATALDPGGAAMAVSGDGAGGPRDGAMALVLASAGNDRAAALVAALGAAGWRVRLVLAGEAAAEGDRVCRTDPDAMAALMADLAKAAPKRAAVIDLVDRPGARDGMTGYAESETLLSALARVRRPRSLRLLLVCPGTAVAAPGDWLAPASALRRGPLLAAVHEIAGLAAATLDPGDAGADAFAAAVAAELAGPFDAARVALRGGERLVEGGEPLSLTPSDSAPPPVETGAAYLISGAGGAIAGLLRDHVAAAGGVPVGLARRRPTDGDAWPHLIVGDVGEPSAWTAAVERIAAAGLRLAGVVHLAGVADGRLLARRTPAGAASVLAPKVAGLDALLAALDGRAVDWVLAASSLTAVEGAPGQSAYCAANAYLDAVAEARALETAARPSVRAVDLAPWRDRGMAARSPAARGHSGGAGVIADTDAPALFDALLATRAPRLIVAPGPVVAPTCCPATVAADAPAIVADPGSGDLGDAVLAGVRTVLGRPDLTPVDDFFAAGGTSLQAVRLAGLLSETTGRPVDPGAVLSHPTAADLARALTDAECGAAGTDDGSDDGGALVGLATPGGHGPPLVLVHPVGGDLFLYRPLAGRLGVPAAIYGLRATDDGGDIVAMATAYAALIEGHFGDQPVALAGSSFGGMVVYEMLCQRADAGLAPTPAVLIDTPGPQDVDAGLADDAAIYAYLARSAGLAVAGDPGHWADLPPDARASTLAEAAAGAGVDLDARAVRRFVARFRANQAAMAAYAPRPFDGPLTFILAAERRYGVDPMHPHAAWAALCPSLTVLNCPGDHISIHEPPQVDRLARLLDQELGRGAATGATVAPKAAVGG